MGIGERLQQARKSRGFTQNALAEAIGVSRGVITNIEHGKTEPQLLVARAICDVLRIHLAWLTDGSGEMDAAHEINKSAKTLSAIYNLAKGLAATEQEYVLDMVKTFCSHRERLRA